jgi:phytol kinase
MIVAVSILESAGRAMIPTVNIKPLVEPWQGLLIVPAAVILLVFGLRALQSLGALHPESVRKGLHVGGGLIVLSFPWLFDRVWPLLVMAGVGIAVLVGLQVYRRLAPKGSLLAGVERKDEGEFYIGPVYFPLAVLLLFWLARGNVLLYAIPLMVLTFADALAALVGVRYGKMKYEATRGRKSVEGSTAFFLAAFFSVHVPLLLLTDLGRAETLLIAVTFGLLLMMVEAVAWSGLDNLFVPLVGFWLLKVYLGLDAEALSWRLGVTLLLAFVALLARGRRWNDAALIVTVLVGYACANLGGWPWLLLALLTFAGVLWIAPPADAAARSVRAVGAVSAVALLWVGAAYEMGRPELLASFAGALACHLAMIALARWKQARPEQPTGHLTALAVVAAALLILLPYGLMTRDPFGTAGAVVGVAVATWLFEVTQPKLETCPDDAGRWWRQTLLAAAGSAGGLAGLLNMS